MLPDAPLPMLSRDVETMVRDCLAKCTIAIHLLGQRYGVTPEDSSESIPALQVRLTAEPDCRPDLAATDLDAGRRRIGRRATARVRAPRAGRSGPPPSRGDHRRQLEPAQEGSHSPPGAAGGKAESGAPAKSAGGAPKLYLICDPKDEAAVEALEDYLFAQGLEVMLPAFDGDDADAAALHQDNLLTCDAVLVYYGDGTQGLGRHQAARAAQGDRLRTRRRRLRSRRSTSRPPTTAARSGSNRTRPA